MTFTFLSSSKDDTAALGKLIASLLSPGDVILLEGDLGAGKTTLVGGVAKGLSIEGDVISPTFNIMKCYFGGTLPLYHIDAYRLEGQNIELGLDEYIEGDGACFIEWPVYIAPLLSDPSDYLVIRLEHRGADSRSITLSTENPDYEKFILAAKERFQ